MDNSNLSKNKQNDHLGVNKIGKNIRKSPLHQPNFVNNNHNNSSIGSNPLRQQSQPQVYNINKNDFRSIVQQLTGSPSQNDPLPRPPPSNPSKQNSMRLQCIRHPPLTPINRPLTPPVVVAQSPLLPQPQGLPVGRPQGHYNNDFPRPSPPQFGQPSPRSMHPFAPPEGNWTTPALSPISAYMQQLQSCIGEACSRPGQQQMPEYGQTQHHMQPQYGQFQAQHQNPMHPQVQARSPSSCLLSDPTVPPMPSPRISGNGLLPSPTSQFLLPSPGGYFNHLSPILRSPGSQFPPPLNPNFAFSPFGHPGILGSGPNPPLSPGILFPPSPSGFFPPSSPRWRDQ